MVKILKQTMLKYVLYGIGTSMFSFLEDSERGRTYQKTKKNNYKSNYEL